MHIGIKKSTRYWRQVLIDPEFSTQIFEKF
jgi:hypothetical protein